MKVCPNPRCHVGSFCDTFCRECGGPLVNGSTKPANNVSCTKCEVGVLSIDKFCGNCGHNLNVVEEDRRKLVE